MPDEDFCFEDLTIGPAATLCDASGGLGIACSSKVAGIDSNGGALQYEFPTGFAEGDIGALSNDPESGEVFLQYNERMNIFLNGVLD